MVVQRLLGLGQSGVFHSIPLPKPTGHYDVATGFWIFFGQQWSKTHAAPNAVVDGTVSPAHAGSSYASSIPWHILVLNAHALREHPNEYARFVSEFDSRG